jgi:alpha-beta hydrolase superfamily lysophospholipase
LLALTLLCVFMIVNLVAYVHARALTHLVRGGKRTAAPEALSRWEKSRVLLTGVTLARPENDATPQTVGLEFTKERIASTDGITLEAWQVPNRAAKGLVLLFHGYAGCKADVLPEAKAFHAMGYALLLIDFRGSGGSDGEETSLGWREAEDVAAAVEFARRKQEELPLILYGHSMGSAAILRALAVHDDLKPAAVILECPFDTLRHTAANRFGAMGLPAFPLADLLIFWGGVQQGFNPFRHNPAEYARYARCPVLFLHGANDPRVTREQAETIFQNVVGEKEFQIFDGAGHGSLCTSCRDEWERSVSGFLTRRLAGKPG